MLWVLRIVPWVISVSASYSVISSALVIPGGSEV